MKKILATMLTITMFLIIGTCSFAAENNGKITVKTPIEGEEYKIYKIFDLESFNKAKGAYSYTITTASPWYDFVTGSGEGASYITLKQLGTSTTYYVEWNETAGNTETVKAEFAKKALAYAKAKPITALTSETAGTTDVVFQNLAHGYYLVDSSLGALCALNTTDTEAEVNEKNEVPTIEKSVEEKGVYGSTNDAELKATVNFKTILHAKKGAENYVLHDRMQGLSYTEDSISLTVNGTPLTANTDYEVKAGSEATNTCEFEIEFKEDYLKTITGNTDIVLEYSATVNEDAVIQGAGNTNETWLTYGDPLEVNQTQKASTVTKVWKFDVFKFTTEGEEKVALENAKFVLSRGNGDYAIIGANNRLTGWTNSQDSANLISANDGYIHIQGLDSGDYTLTEIEAPAGYNKLAGPIAITINADGTVKQNGTVVPNELVEVENFTGAVLPSTGGIGTKIFYIVGGTLFIIAISFIIIRNRMNTEE